MSSYTIRLWPPSFRMAEMFWYDSSQKEHKLELSAFLTAQKLIYVVLVSNIR